MDHHSCFMKIVLIHSFPFPSLSIPFLTSSSFPVLSSTLSFLLRFYSLPISLCIACSQLQNQVCRAMRSVFVFCVHICLSCFSPFFSPCIFFAPFLFSVLLLSSFVFHIFHVCFMHSSLCYFSFFFPFHSVLSKNITIYSMQCNAIHSQAMCVALVFE